MSTDTRTSTRPASPATSSALPSTPARGTTPRRSAGPRAPRRRGIGPHGWRRLFVSPSVLILLVLAAYPLLFIVTATVSESSLGRPFEEFVGVETLESVLAAERVQDSLLRGTVYALAVTATSTALGTVTALALWRTMRTGSLIRTILLLPMIVPPVVVGILFSFILSPSGGLIDTLLHRVLPQFETPAVLSDQFWAIIGVGAADVWEWTPLVVLLVFTALLGQDPQIEEAAQLDGAGGFQLFRHITLPAVGATIAAAFLIRLILAFKVFDLVYVMTSGGPGSATLVPAYMIWQTALQHFDVGAAAAITLLLAVIVSLVTLPAFALTRRLRHD